MGTPTTLFALKKAHKRRQRINRTFHCDGKRLALNPRVVPNYVNGKTDGNFIARAEAANQEIQADGIRLRRNNGG